jgi:hypothetical protein
VKKTSKFSEYGSNMNMPSGDGNNLAFHEKYCVVFKRLQRDIEYAIKLNFTVWSNISMLKKEGSDVNATTLKEDESPPQSMHSPVARSAIISPAVCSSSPVTVAPIPTSQRQLYMVAVASTATGSLAK